MNRSNQRNTLLLATLILLLAGQWDADVEERAALDYCQMVELFEKTNGEYGWPPREGLVCAPEQPQVID